MSVPYTFANAVGTLPLSQLDSNFAAVEAYSNTAGTVTNNAQPNITSVGTLSSLAVSGNISASFYSGNGRNLTGIVANTTYNNSNVAAFLPTYTGNITADNIVITGLFVGNGASLSQISGPNVVGIVTSAATANLANIAATVTDNAQPNITSVGTLTSLSVTGNITGDYILGNGSQLTGLPEIYGNANVVANLAALGTNPITTSGNITAGYFIGDGSQLTGIGNAPDASTLTGNTLSSNVVYSSLTTVGTLGSLVVSGNIDSDISIANRFETTGNVNASGNISAGNIIITGAVTAIGNVNGDYIFGNGSQLTSLTIPTQKLIANGNASVSCESTGAGNVYIYFGSGDFARFGESPLNPGSHGLFTTGFVSTANLQANLARVVGNMLVGGNFTTAGNITANTITGNISITSTGDLTGNVVIASTSIKTTPVTVATLPGAALVGAGSRAFVTDADSFTFSNLAVGGGGFSVPVFSNGTNWYIG